VIKRASEVAGYSDFFAIEIDLPQTKDEKPATLLVLNFSFQPGL
jgi:hypothetical protein